MHICTQDRANQLMITAFQALACAQPSSLDANPLGQAEHCLRYLDDGVRPQVRLHGGRTANVHSLIRHPDVHRRTVGVAEYSNGRNPCAQAAKLGTRRKEQTLPCTGTDAERTESSRCGHDAAGDLAAVRYQQLVDRYLSEAGEGTRHYSVSQEVDIINGIIRVIGSCNSDSARLMV